MPTFATITIYLFAASPNLEPPKGLVQEIWIAMSWPATSYYPGYTATEPVPSETLIPAFRYDGSWSAGHIVQSSDKTTDNVLADAKSKAGSGDNPPGTRSLDVHPVWDGHKTVHLLYSNVPSTQVLFPQDRVYKGDRPFQRDAIYRLNEATPQIKWDHCGQQFGMWELDCQPHPEVFTTLPLNGPNAAYTWVTDSLPSDRLCDAFENALDPEWKLKPLDLSDDTTVKNYIEGIEMTRAGNLDLYAIVLRPDVDFGETPQGEVVYGTFWLWTMDHVSFHLIENPHFDGMALVSLADFDGDGTIDAIFEIGGENMDGFILYYAGLKKSIRYAWGYH